MSDNVNHPSHYTQGGIECIEAIKASMSPEGFQDYCNGNVLKYIWRWRDKAGVEDLEKARVYLSWLIESAEKNKPKTENGSYIPLNGKKINLEYVKIDPSSLEGWVRDLYFNSIIEDLRVCSSHNGCSGCRRAQTEKGCDMMESDAADAIKFLLEELKEKENENT